MSKIKPPMFYTFPIEPILESITACVLTRCGAIPAVERVVELISGELFDTMVSQKALERHVYTFDRLDELQRLGVPKSIVDRILFDIDHHALSRHYREIDNYLYRCKFNYNVTMQWSRVDASIVIAFTPVPLDVDLDQIVSEIVDRLIDEDKFVPYKYLQVLGRL